MNDHPDIRCAEFAHAAACGHWVIIGGKFLVLSSGRELCPSCGAQWAVSASERRALLGVRPGSGSRAKRQAGADSKIGNETEKRS